MTKCQTCVNAASSDSRFCEECRAEWRRKHHRQYGWEIAARYAPRNDLRVRSDVDHRLQDGFAALNSAYDEPIEEGNT